MISRPSPLRPSRPTPWRRCTTRKASGINWTTKIFVYWPKALLKLINKSEAPLIDRVQENGDFIRQLDRSEALAADEEAFPINAGFEIDLSNCARDRLKGDGGYRPMNIREPADA